MKRNRDKHSRPPTVWIDESTFHQTQLDSKSTATADMNASPSQMRNATAIALGSKKPRPNPPDARIPHLNQNPWDTFEPVAALQDRSLVFARHRENRGTLVHIQQLEQQMAPAAALLELMGHVCHPSFPKLLQYYHHDTSSMLVWEPTEVSVDHILASSCSITADEIVSIVRPVCQTMLWDHSPLIQKRY